MTSWPLTTPTTRPPTRLKAKNGEINFEGSFKGVRETELRSTPRSDMAMKGTAAMHASKGMSSHARGSQLT
jgi:hypothetical protein